jgi:hypothetical protein
MRGRPTRRRRIASRSRRMPLDLNLLFALHALLKEQSVGRAARALGVAQPTMSRMLRGLREYFDDVLLERIGRRHQLSPKAEALLEPLQWALRCVAQVLEATEPVGSAALQVGAFHGSAPGALRSNRDAWMRRQSGGSREVSTFPSSFRPYDGLPADPQSPLSITTQEDAAMNVDMLEA